MAYGSHWEWRGFGGVSSKFVQIYSSLDIHYKYHTMQDKYLWIPGLSLNVKFREGAENGLKFKRPEKKDGNFEVWVENEDELFDFPLSEEAWNSLLAMLETTDLTLPGDPPSSFTRNKLEGWLKKAGCIIVEVHKERETKIWHGNGGSILVEWACITKPQSIISIGLENYSQSETDDNLTSDTDKQIMESALETLGLDREPLCPMNYMEAVKLWAEGNKI